MSDDDDWPSSDEDEKQVISIPGAPAHSRVPDEDGDEVGTNTPLGQSPKDTADEASDTPAKACIVFYVPALLLLGHKPPEMVAGATVLHGAALSFSDMTFLFYDQNRRTLIGEQNRIADTTKADSTDASFPPALSFSFKVASEPPAGSTTGQGNFGASLNTGRLVDRLKRQWTVQFRNRAESIHFQTMVLLAQCKIKAYHPPGPTTGPLAGTGVGNGTGSACEHVDVWTGGEGKKLKSKYYASVRIVTWKIARGTDALNAFKMEIDGSQAQVDAMTQLLDVKPSDSEEKSKVISNLGEAVCKMKEGGQRLFVATASSPFVEDLREQYEQAQMAAAEPSAVFVIFLHVEEVYKKRKGDKQKEKKAKKERKEKRREAKGMLAITDGAEQSTTAATAGAASATPIPAPAAASGTSAAAPAKAASTTSVATSSLAVATVSEPEAVPEITVDTLLLRMKALLTDVQSGVNALGATQTKIVKKTMSELYATVVASLDEEAVAANTDDVGNGASPEDDDDDANKVVQLGSAKQTMASAMRSVVESYLAMNEHNVPGTITSAESSFEELLSAYADFSQRIVELSSGEQKQQAAAASAEELSNKNREIAELKAQLKAQQSAAEKSKREVAELGKKQMDLATLNMDLEEKLADATKNSEKLKAKMQNLEVFESAANDMRKMYDAEVENRSKLEAELANLTTVQKRYKLNWVPSDAVNFCLACRSKFSMFGKKKHHCRYCGRMFCHECSNKEVALPELGFPQAVRVCHHCYAFKMGQFDRMQVATAGGAAASSSAQDDEEDDDDDY